MNTLARIATVCQFNRFSTSIADNNAAILESAEIALSQKPDLICLPECFNSVSLPIKDAREVAEPLDGPTIQLFADVARRGCCYVIAPILTREQDVVYNSAVILDRQGEIAGVYHKNNPVTSVGSYDCLEHGVRPGDEAGIFDLDFGRIGLATCFDVGFPEMWEKLARADCRIVFWSSAYHGGKALEAFASLYNLWVVTSVRVPHSRIIDPGGYMLQATDDSLHAITREINLDYAVCHSDFNSGLPDRIRAKYGDRVKIYAYPDDVLLIIEPQDAKLTIAQLQKEFGFETRAAYHDRHRAAYRALRENGATKPQQAPHGLRGPYEKV